MGADAVGACVVGDRASPHEAGLAKYGGRSRAPLGPFTRTMLLAGRGRGTPVACALDSGGMSKDVDSDGGLRNDIDAGLCGRPCSA